MKVVQFNGLGQPDDPDVGTGTVLVLVQGDHVSVVRVRLLPPDEFGPELTHALNDAVLEPLVRSAVRTAYPEWLDSERHWLLACPADIAEIARFESANENRGDEGRANVLTEAAATSRAYEHLATLSVSSAAFTVAVTEPVRGRTGWIFEYRYDCSDGPPPALWEAVGGAPGFLVSDEGELRTLSAEELQEERIPKPPAPARTPSGVRGALWFHDRFVGELLDVHENDWIWYAQVKLVIDGAEDAEARRLLEYVRFDQESFARAVDDDRSTEEVIASYAAFDDVIGCNGWSWSPEGGERRAIDHAPQFLGGEDVGWREREA